MPNIMMDLSAKTWHYINKETRALADEADTIQEPLLKAQIGDYIRKFFSIAKVAQGLSIERSETFVIPVDWHHCSPELLTKCGGLACTYLPRRACQCKIAGSHDHLVSVWDNEDNSHS